MKYIEAIEYNLSKKSKKILLPIQDGDVPSTSSDCTRINEWVNFKPNTPIEIGVKNFINWYKDFYKITL